MRAIIINNKGVKMNKKLDEHEAALTACEQKSINSYFVMLAIILTIVIVSYIAMRLIESY